MNLSRALRFRRLARLVATLGMLGTLLGLAGVANAQDRLKIGTVDMSKVFKEYYKTTEAEGMIRTAREAANKELDSRMENHHRLLEEIARLEKEIADPALSAELKANRLKARNDKVQETHLLERDIQDYKTSREKQLQEQTIRVRTQIVEDIMVIVNARVERDHYDLILNRSARGVGAKLVVLHADDSMEFSDDVIAVLNKNRPAAAAAAATSTPAPAATPAR